MSFPTLGTIKGDFGNLSLVCNKIHHNAFCCGFKWILHYLQNTPPICVPIRYLAELIDNSGINFSKLNPSYLREDDEFPILVYKITLKIFVYKNLP